MAPAVHGFKSAWRGFRPGLSLFETIAVESEESARHPCILTDINKFEKTDDNALQHETT